jgi:pimeloyl-ACP methyl ester carboxylesterase
MRLFQAVAALLLLVFAAPAWAQSDDGRIAVTVEGTGPDVILIPGLASSSAVWDSTAARLSARYRVHRIQVAGFAGAPAGANGEGAVAAPTAEAIAAYIDRNRLRSPAIIGHSLGGEIGLMIAARHPDRVGRVMAVDALPFYSLLFNPAATAESVRPQADAMRDMLLAQNAEQARAATAMAIAGMIRTEAARPPAIAWGNSSDRGVVVRAMHELMTTDLRPELGRIAAPVTILYAYDPVYGVPAERIDTLFRSAYGALPQARLARIDDSFHFIMLDQPADFAEAVETFLGQP